MAALTHPVELHRQLVAVLDRIESHGWGWAWQGVSGENRYGQYKVLHVFLTRPHHPHAVQVSQDRETGEITFRTRPHHTF